MWYSMCHTIRISCVEVLVLKLTSICHNKLTLSVGCTVWVEIFSSLLYELLQYWVTWEKLEDSSFVKTMKICTLSLRASRQLRTNKYHYAAKRTISAVPLVGSVGRLPARPPRPSTPHWCFSSHTTILKIHSEEVQTKKNVQQRSDILSSHDSTKKKNIGGKKKAYTQLKP